MSSGPRPLSRRTTLALGGAVLLSATGCDAPWDSSGQAEPTSTPSADPDAQLVKRVLAQLRQALRSAHSTQTMQSLAGLHATHIEALGGTVPTLAPGPTPDAWGEAWTRKVLRQERRLQARLAAAAGAAQDGALARMLASMSAAVAQELTAMDAS